MSAARFSIIPGWVVTDRRLKPRDLQVLCLLGRHTDRHGWCMRSQVKMAAELDCARSTVQAAIDRLCEIGVVEKHERETKSGADTAHDYRVIFDRPPPSGYAFGAWEEAENEEENPNSTEAEVHTPADISAPPAGPESAPPADSGPAPINVPRLTPPAEREEREGARERASSRPAGAGQNDEIVLRGEGPRATPTEGGESHDDRRSLTKRVKAIEIGRNDNPWPGARGSSTDWAVTQFAKLDEAERREAEAKRDAYLAICKAEGVKPVAVGIYFRDRKFLDVDTARARAAVRKAERVAVRPFGPIWAGMRGLALGAGPCAIDMPGDVHAEAEALHATMMRASERSAAAWRERKGLTLGPGGRLVFPDDFERAEFRRRQVSDGFPAVNHLHSLARDARAELVDGINAALGELCEAVPVGSEIYEAWKAFHERAGWPLWPDPGRMAVVYFPKGGPEGWDAFLRAARAAVSEGGRDADAA